MKTSKMLKTIVLSLLMAGVADTLFAQQGGKADQRKQRIEKMKEKRQQARHVPRLPDLTDQQKEDIKQIMLNTREQVLPLQNQLREKAARLKTMRTADEVDMGDINSTVEEVGSLRTEIMKQRLASEQEVRELLTDEQRIVYDSRRSKGKNGRMKQWLNR